MFASMVSSLHHAKSGKLKALSVTSPRRSSVVPDYPTVAESGVPGFEMVGYFGMLAPANTPTAVVKTVHQAVQRAIKRRDFVERISADGAEPDGCTPTELHELLEHDMRKLAELMQGVKVQRQ
jgi:tripartite-type tricarboxylate transporter receptor subunit TctC